VSSVQKARIDETGVENVCAAISFAVKTFLPMNKKMFLIIITDEEGDDTKNDKAFMQALQDMQTAKARLYVFGREAQFQQSNAFEWLRDAKGERVGPWFWAQRGIESCQQEFFTTDWLFNHHRSERLIGSGFGCWSLTTLADLTKGVFFILAEVPSPYDEEKLEKFKPEWVTRADYTARNVKSKLRASLRKIVDEWKQLDPPPWLTQLDRLKAERDEAIGKAEKALKFVEGAIDEMEALHGHRSGEKFAKMRWQGNYDLAMAELYKFRFMLRDYIAALRNTRTAGFPKPKPNQKFNVYRMLYNNTLTEPRTGQRGLKEWEQAKKAFDQIINNNEYDGTPWSEVAKHEKATTAPIWVYPTFHVEPTRPKG
jgi:tetratricopeptide (TPR) repeat protein